MKEKDIINSVELERLDHERFRSFDPENELWIVGGSKTTTMGPTGRPDEWLDAWVDYDWTF